MSDKNTVQNSNVTLDAQNKLWELNFNYVLFSGLLLSIVLFVVGVTNNSISGIFPGNLLKELSMIIFGGVLVTFFHQKILGDYFKNKSENTFLQAITPKIENIEQSISDQLSNIVPDVKDATEKSIDDIRVRVADATDYIKSGIGVLRGAKAAGIVNIFPTRYEKIFGESVIDVIEKDLKAEQNIIRIMGISLGDYFLDRGVLHNSFEKILKDNANSGLIIQALLVNPKSLALKERARWEAGQEYYREPIFYDSTTYIETDGAARIARRLCEKYNNLEIKLYDQSPTAFVLLTNRFAFIESYNYAARGSNVPIFQVQAGVSLFRHYESHFKRIWDVAQSIGSYNPLEEIPGADGRADGVGPR